MRAPWEPDQSGALQEVSSASAPLQRGECS